MANAVDLHVGKRLRRRRRLLGLTQQQLGESIGIRMQQVQKHECGANRVSASRLFELSIALNVPVEYFFQGLDRPDSGLPETDQVVLDDAAFSNKETAAIVRAYYALNDRARRRLLDLAIALRDDSSES